jgi:hypothetical protein
VIWTRSWSLNAELTLEPNSVRYGNPFELSVNVLPGWKRASAETRERIVAAAKRFLAAYTPQEAHTWIKSNSFPWATLAGYRALLLLLTEAPEFIAALSPSSWEKWASITLAYPVPDSNATAESRQRLLKLAYEKVPDIVLGALVDLIDKENDNPGILAHLRHSELAMTGLYMKEIPEQVKAAFESLYRDFCGTAKQEPIN